jgi:hypothetical protein
VEARSRERSQHKVWLEAEAKIAHAFTHPFGFVRHQIGDDDVTTRSHDAMHFARSSIVIGQVVPDEIRERRVHFFCIEWQCIKLTLTEVDARHVGARFDKHALTVIDANDFVTALGQPCCQEASATAKVDDLRAARPSLRKNLGAQRADDEVLANAVPLLSEAVVGVATLLTAAIEHGL